MIHHSNIKKIIIINHITNYNKSETKKFNLITINLKQKKIIQKIIIIMCVTKIFN